MIERSLVIFNFLEKFWSTLDYLTIYDVNDEEHHMVIANLSSPDVGPQSQHLWSNWQKKIISSSSNTMLVKFISDHIRKSDIIQFAGFSASIHYSPIQECETSLDMTKKIIQSPNYFDSYDNNLSCK